MTSKAMSPNHREAITAVSSITGLDEYIKSTNGAININGTIGGSALPISGATTGVGVAILDGSGNQITSFGGGTQYTQGGATVANPTGTAEIWFDGSGNPKAITPSQPLPSNITDGTNAANVVAGDTGYNALPIANSTKTLTFTTSSSGAQMLLSDTDCRGYGFITVVATSVGSGLAWQGQFSPNSGGTYISTQTFSNAGQAANSANNLGTTVSTLYGSPIYGPYFRLNVTALTSGTLSGYVILSTQPMPYHAITAAQSGTWTVGSNSATGSAFPANAFAMGVKATSGNLAALGVPSQTLNSALSAGEGLTTALAAQFDDVSPTAITENNFGNLRISTNRNLYSTIRDAAGNERGANVNASNQLSVSVDNSNVSTNLAQLAGNTISSGVGTSGTGTLRTVIANDTGRTLLSKGGSASSSGDNTLVAAGTNKLKVYAFSLSTTSTTAVTCIFQSGASGTELWRVVLQAPTSVSTGANLVVQPPAWLFATASATLLNLNLSGAQTVHWSVSYWDEA